MYYSCFTPLNVPENQNDLDHPYLESAIALSDMYSDYIHVCNILLTVNSLIQVEEGASLVTLEAMKMQNPLFAPMTGKVSQFNQCAV